MTAMFPECRPAVVFYLLFGHIFISTGKQTSILMLLVVYRLCQKKLYNFQFLFAEKVNKAQQQHSGGQNIIVLCLRRFLNGIIPWLGVKVMVH